MGSTKDNTRSDKHNRILKAAVRVFARYGYFNSKVAQIAREANVADGTIYLYFKNKEDILLSLFEDRMDGIIGDLRGSIGDETDPFRRLTKFISLHFDLIRKDPDLVSVITVELRQSAKFMKEYRNDKFREYLDIVEDIVNDGKSSGVVRQDVSPLVVKRGLFGMINELMLSQVLSRRRNAQELSQLAQQVIEISIRGIAIDPEQAIENGCKEV